MSNLPKQKKRGFVMTGGGAKGLYEAGVIHAFHISGMEFDVITGSSIGAMNSIFFAEYLWHKRQLSLPEQKDPGVFIEKLDPYVKAFHHAWLDLPERKIVDDSEQGPIGQFKSDLEKVKVDVPLLVRLGWWWTDPDKRTLPPAATLPGLAGLVDQAVRHLGGINEVLRILKFHRASLFREATRTYLRRFSLERALVPKEQEKKIHDFFTTAVTPLTPGLLEGQPELPGATPLPLVDPGRTFKDYADHHIAVRLTRANYRSGRLEMSAYVTPVQFLRFMEKQAWRVQSGDPDQIPLGAFRLVVPGNPNAINAAICSGRFPGVFAPFPIEDIYPRSDPENRLLDEILDNWLASDTARAALKQAYTELHGPASNDWDTRVNSWRDSDALRNFFPQRGDVFVDGGTIDNTPSNSAVDFAKDWVEENGGSKRGIKMELFVIYLEVEPKADRVKVDDPASYEVVKRTLDIQGVAKKTAEANTLSTINTFGDRAEDLAVVLQSVLASYQELCAGLSPEQQRQLQQNLYEQVRKLGIKGLRGQPPEGALEHLEQWTAQVLANSLPVEVEPVKIYPEQMPLDTLQFTERLGYRRENAILMLTMGCYNTLWSLRKHLEAQFPASSGVETPLAVSAASSGAETPLAASGGFDDLDRQVLELTRKWMGIGPWPAKYADQEKIRGTWQCQRTACAFHAARCAHGAKRQVQVSL